MGPAKRPPGYRSPATTSPGAPAPPAVDLETVRLAFEETLAVLLDAGVIGSGTVTAARAVFMSRLRLSAGWLDGEG